jgi:predicted DNA-binding protein (UPF0251 family)
MSYSARLEDGKVKRRSKGIRKSSRRRRSKPRRNAWSITTIEQFFALPQRTQEILLALPEAVSLMKSNDIPARRAAGAAGISRSTLIRRGGSALKKLANGRYATKPNDHLFRPVIVVSENGPVEVATRNFREASKAGKHFSAVERYLGETGDDSALRRFRGKYIIDAQGNRIWLLTDTDELDRLGSRGELSFESLYKRSR